MKVLRFDEPDCAEVASAGGKGASLARMAGLDLPVPPGFVVPAGALAASLGDDEQKLREALKDGAGAEAAERCRELVLAAELEAELAEAIATAHGELGEEPSVAVRSSACAEDSETASYAGQQETFLGVHGADDVLARVRDCWASFFAERALFYREKKGSLDDLAMAVVVQRMVAADVAGVLFTCDPVRRRRDRMVVEAVFGLGETAVSGQVTPGPLRAHPGGRGQEAAGGRAAAGAGRGRAGRDRRARAERGGGRRRRPSTRSSCARWPAWAPTWRRRSGRRRTSSGPSRTASCTCCRHAR